MGFLDVLFPASKGSIMRKGTSVANGTGPVRMRKSPNIIQSLFGVLIGIALVFGSPLAMWWAQSQHTAEDFASALSVEAESSEAGYITFRGAPSFIDADGGAECQFGDCIYQDESQQELVTTMDLVCGNSVKSTSSMRVLEQNGSECDENGDCVPCYDVEKDEWEEIVSIESYYDVMVGSYTVSPEGATLLDTKERTVMEETEYDDFNFENEKRSVFTYYPLPSNLLVAGYSDGSRVTSGEMVYVLSEFDSTITLQKLEARDSANQKLLWFVTFMMLLIGISLIFGPLAWMGRQMRFVPVIGPMLAKGSSAMIGAASLVLAIPLWIALFVIIVIIKSWWIALILVALILLGILWKVKKGAQE
jgi:hypothetical protein